MEQEMRLTGWLHDMHTAKVVFVGFGGRTYSIVERDEWEPRTGNDVRNCLYCAVNTELDVLPVYTAFSKSKEDREHMTAYNTTALQVRGSSIARLLTVRCEWSKK